MEARQGPRNVAGQPKRTSWIAALLAALVVLGGGATAWADVVETPASSTRSTGSIAATASEPDADGAVTLSIPADGSGTVTVVGLSVESGDEVSAGDALATLVDPTGTAGAPSASLLTPVAGVVELAVSAGDVIGPGAVVATVAPASAGDGSTDGADGADGVDEETPTDPAPEAETSLEVPDESETTSEPLEPESALAPLAESSDALLPEIAPLVAVPTGGIQARMGDHTGWNVNTGPRPRANDCVRYGILSNSSGAATAPNAGGYNGSYSVVNSPARSDGYTAWVGSGTTAYSAHGNNSCSSINLVNGSGGGVALNAQSALGFAPSSLTDIETGQIFNLGRMVHRNNPVSVVNNWFRGQMQIQFAGMELTYNWRLHETPNSSNPASNPANNDLLDFLNQISDQTFQIDGLTYTLVVHGFTAPQGSNNTCSATVPDLGQVINEFSTVEGTTTYGCLYASVQQVRTLEVVKQVESPYAAAASIPAFAFDSSSTYAGSPWSSGFGLTPTGTGTNGSASTGAQRFVVGQTVTIAEQAPTSPWTFTALQCVDGTGAPIGQVSGSSVTLTGNLTAASSAAAPIVCTYTNTYVPQATLTLQKTVVSTGQPGAVATPWNWTLSAQGTGAVSAVTVSGRGQTGQDDAAPNADITARTVIAGTYQLAEVSDGSDRTEGYAQEGPWVCVVTGTQTPVTVSGSTVTLAHGQNVTCRVTNVFQTGSLAITKTVITSLPGGYVGGAATAFTARYDCGTVSGEVTVTPSAQVGEPGAAAIVENLPAGSTCTVSELDPPTGTSDGLLDPTWIWQEPQISPAEPVTIPVGDSVSVNITNPAATSQITLLKSVPDGWVGPQNWALSATPSPGVDGLAGASGIIGGAEQTASNTFTVRPEHEYSLTEALAPGSDVAYLERGVEVYDEATGTWVEVPDPAAIAAPAAGGHDVYRFVNAPPPSVTLPLTGGLGRDGFMIGGAAFLAAAAALGLWGRHRGRARMAT